MNYSFLLSYLSPLTPIPNLTLNLAFWMEMEEGCAHPLRPVHHAVQGFAPSASLRRRAHSLLKLGKVLIPHSNIYITLYMAEREGFEPSIPL